MNKQKSTSYRYSNVAMFNWFLGKAECHRHHAYFATNEMMRQCYRSMMRDNALRAIHYMKAHFNSTSYGN